MYIAKAKLLWFMCAFEALRFKAYPHEIIAGIVGRIGETALYVTFWFIISAYATNGGIDMLTIVSYYLIASGLNSFLYLGMSVASRTMKLIKLGELNQILIRPVSPFLYPLALATGRSAVNLIFGLVQIIIGVILIGGLKIHLLPMLIPVLIGAWILNVAFNMIIGTFAFYLTEAEGIKNGFYFTARLLRGEMMPLYLMPVGFAHALQLTPFPASQYYVVVLLQGINIPSWQDIAIGLAWVPVVLAFAVWFWKRGLKTYEGVGI